MKTDLLLKDYLQRLRLPAIAGIYHKIAREAQEKNLSYGDYLLILLEQEGIHREENAQMRRIKQARFPYLKTLDSFDFAALSIDKQKVLELTRCEYLKACENIIFIGNPGLGKTHLAIALAVEAAKEGYRVRFFTAAALTNEMIEAEKAMTLSSYEKKLSRFSLLIVDELGFVPFSRKGTQFLFQFFSFRYETGSVIITSNLDFANWTEVFGSERLTGALLDRVTHHSHIIQLQGESCRFRQTLGKYKLNKVESSDLIKERETASSQVLPKEKLKVHSHQRILREAK